jgi:hypothetical protein
MTTGISGDTCRPSSGPTLLEFTGPLFLSSAILSNVQYQLSESEGGTLLTFRHTAFGSIPEEIRGRLGQGWKPLLERIRKQAEANTYKR